MKFLSLSLPDFGNIQAPSGIPSGGLDTTGQKTISLGLNLLFIGGILLALAFLIYAGILWMTAGGDKQKLQTARTQVIWSIIGLIIIFLSIFLIQFIGNFFDISFIKDHP